MKNIITTIVFALALFLAPAAVAQHSGHGTGHGSSGGGHTSGGSHTTGNVQHGRQNGSGRYQRGNNGVDRGRFDVNRGRLRGDLETGRFGRGHSYYGRDFRWYGTPYGIGSRFFVGGFWFNVIGPWPAYWGPDCGYFIEYNDVMDSYVVGCPTYPGVFVSVGIL